MKDSAPLPPGLTIDVLSALLIWLIAHIVELVIYMTAVAVYIAFAADNLVLVFIQSRQVAIKNNAGNFRLETDGIF